MSLKHGGLELQDYKNLPLKNPLFTAGLPKLALLPLAQPGGEPYEPLFSPGAMVEEEQVVAKTKDGFPLHSPIPGKVVDFRNIQLPGIGLTKCILIQLSGSFKFTGKERAGGDWKKLSKTATLEKRG